MTDPTERYIRAREIEAAARSYRHARVAGWLRIMLDHVDASDVTPTVRNAAASARAVLAECSGPIGPDIARVEAERVRAAP